MTDNTKAPEVERFTECLETKETDGVLDTVSAGMQPDATGYWVRYTDYSALRAELAEARAEREEWFKKWERSASDFNSLLNRLTAAEADAERLTNAALWLEIWGGLLATHVAGHFALPTDSSEKVCKQHVEHVRRQIDASTKAREQYALARAARDVGDGNG